MIKFGLFADLHVDIMHDGQRRLEAFLEAARREKVDFIIHLGDFCYPDSKICVCKPEHRPVNIELAMHTETLADKEKIVGMYRDFETPKYHVIGNHDCDFCSKEEVLAFEGAENGPYCSFDAGGFHFIILDANYYRVGDEYFSFDHGNYWDCSHEGGSLPWLPPQEIQWLKEDLARAQYPSVLFSHQRLLKGKRAICNADEVEDILLHAPHGVVLSLNGHEHMDEVTEHNGIWYCTVNSISNHWVGEEFEVLGRYGEEIDEKYPNLRYVLPYEEPLFDIIEMDEHGAKITGVQGREHGKTAREMGLLKGADCGGSPLRTDVTASIEDRYLPFNRREASCI